MFDIITFGSASQDIYLESKKFLRVRGKGFTTGEGVCFNIGSKIEVEEAFFSSGGGGTNTAATFAKQGLKIAYCGQVGSDCFGNLIINELKELKISTDLISKTTEKPTNISVILTYPAGDRTILTYRGASDILEKKNIPWNKIKNTKWFYLAPFSGKLVNLTEPLINFAKEKGIKVAFNPGYKQLNFSRLIIERILKKVDILILNQEEASLLTKISFQKEKEIFKKLDNLVNGIVIMTKGAEGVVVSDGKYLYYAESLGFKIVDRTGAGDAFGSGFLSGMIKKDDIIFAIQLAMANSGSAITKWGAKGGLLEKGQKWQKVSVKKDNCGK